MVLARHYTIIVRKHKRVWVFGNGSIRVTWHYHYHIPGKVIELE